MFVRLSDELKRNEEVNVEEVKVKVKVKVKGAVRIGKRYQSEETLSY